MLSIDSQVTELTRLAQQRGLAVKEVLTEAYSAKAPGRPVFTAMMERAYRAEVQGVICWKLDRLARNPVDGGTVIWAMKQSGLEVITPTQTFRQSDDNTILMYIEFGMAQKYIDDLSRNVRRGLRTRVERGWYPSYAPLGYLNNPVRLKDDKAIIPDPERFALVRRIWDLMLTGCHSPPEILRMANEEWGFRTREARKQGGKPLGRSTIYQILTDPFYYGRFEYPRGSGQWYEGRHESMVTEEEYNHVQVLLGRPRRKQAAHLSFPFTRLIQCGECGAKVTAEEKHQIICPSCKCKFSSRSADRCIRCGLEVEKMRRPTRLHYTYYHCTKKRDPTCSQPSVRSEDLEAQIAAYLARVSIPSRILQWALRVLAALDREEYAQYEQIRASRERARADCQKRLDNLLRLKTAPGNGDGALLSDEEYERQRLELLHEKATLGAQYEDPAQQHRRALEETADIFRFASCAHQCFLEGDDNTKRQIVSAIGSNLTLTDRKLRIQAIKPFEIIETSLSGSGHPPEGFEPAEGARKSTRSGPSEVGLRIGWAKTDDVRTWYLEGWNDAVRGIIGFLQKHPNELQLPVLRSPVSSSGTNNARDHNDMPSPPEQKDAIRAA